MSIKNYFTKILHELEGNNDNNNDNDNNINDEKCEHLDTPAPFQNIKLKKKERSGALRDGALKDVVMKLENVPVTRQEASNHFKYMLIIFESTIRILSHKTANPFMKVNMCAKKEQDMIITTGLEFACIEKYIVLQLRGIYIALIFIYYALNLLEQTSDGLSISDLKSFFDEGTYNIAVQLINDITIYDIYDENNENISSKIRKRFMGIT